MRRASKHLPIQIFTLLFAVFASGTPLAGDAATSGFGAIALPQPSKPVDAETCVAPVAVMRRDHMKFLMHQRDATVIDGKRDGKHSLVGCIDCHNPTPPDGNIVRYDDAQHFCAACHQYAGVKIDCFECHADRGLPRSRQNLSATNFESTRYSMHSLRQRVVENRVD